MIETMQIEFEIVTCGECGCQFGIPKGKMKDLRETKAAFWCPNGHTRAFSKSTAEVLQERIGQQEKKIAELETGKAAAIATVERLEKRLKSAKRRK